MSLHLFVAAVTRAERGAYAWRLDRPDGGGTEATGRARADGASLWRLALHAVLDGLSNAPPDLSVRLHLKDATLRQTLSSWIFSWERNGWKRDRGAVGDQDLLRPIAVRLRERTVTVVEGDSPALAEGARATLMDDDAPVAATPAFSEAVPGSAAPLVAWTDGGCRRNPGPGGWGFLLIHQASGATLMRRGGAKETTNNRMELSAVLELLRALKAPSTLEIRADSKYVIQSATQWMAGWKRRGWQKIDKDGKTSPVANVDLIQALDEAMAPHRITWTWVEGHSGDPGNERVDALANAAMDAVMTGADPAWEERLAAPPFTLLPRGGAR
jgi:ribonuclease HI